ncbi:hypothetical protein Cgig2_025906 [Carnegiea gigantea]|uniref:Uncharacterized protein n=1 Tax=Carnegiea gigantea TaxID=171969 RepID=A0A9Q1K571_9CARY|nr:hypothetical protein Cgig2_025906 [Carnegiea gigantea]
MNDDDAALRRYQAVHWLEHFVGPLGMPREPSEKEFISRLRNGLILCNLINKIKPGSVPKVVENYLPLQSEPVSWDSQPLPAYQYFENVRNFLVAVKGLNLPAFEASDLERENFEAGSAARVADCILALKSYHEWKEWSGGTGVYKHVTAKSPLVLHSAAKNFTWPLSTVMPQPRRRLDMSPVDDRQSLKDSLVKALTEQMVESKENMNNNFLTSLQNGNQDPVQIFHDILSRCLGEKLRNKIPASFGDQPRESRSNCLRVLQSQERDLLVSLLFTLKSTTVYRSCTTLYRGILHCKFKQCYHKNSNIKALWSQTKRDFEDLQAQLFDDLNHLDLNLLRLAFHLMLWRNPSVKRSYYDSLHHLGSLVEDMSAPALGYQKVVQENRKLYNMVQDLKGEFFSIEGINRTIRVYCRVKPILNAQIRNVIDFVGEDGSLVVFDPSEPKNNGRKAFQFNRVYSPSATQDELFKDAQPLIRSAMDGHSVCILAYGQAGSGKTHTMYGSSEASAKETGIVLFALNDLFEMANKRKDMISYEVYLQMVEICNEQLQDLLDEDSASRGELSLSDVSLHSVRSAVDAVNLVKQSRTKCSSIAMNSSHSHSVVIVHVHGKDTSGNNLHGRLHLVDLAGTGEVWSRNSENPGNGLVNQLTDKSLSCLEDVLTSLSQKNSHIPYRNCKLTYLLQDALGAHAKILMFAHVSPEGGHFAETVSTLKFAQRVSTVELGAAHLNRKNSEVLELKQEIETLKSQLAEKDVRTPQPNKQLRSPCEKAKVATERTPLPSRRLSLENGGAINIERQPKSPLKRPVLTTESAPQKSLGSTTENSITRKTDKATDAGASKSSMLEGSVPRSRRLSIENPMIVRSEKTQRMKDPKSPNEGKKGFTRPTPQRTRRLSIETPIPMKSDVESISLVGNPKNPQSSVCLNQPTFTDCATQFPSVQPPKTPEHQKTDPHDEVQTVMHSGVKVPTDSQTPATAKSTNGKGSQIRKSLRTIGKLINGSEKRYVNAEFRTFDTCSLLFLRSYNLHCEICRSQQKTESLSLKGKSVANEAKSPPTSKGRASRRQSLTGIPPSGPDRRSSLGGTPTEARK